MEKSVLLLKAIADASRMEIIKVLADGSKHVELIAEATSLTSGTVSFHLKKLEAVGLVSQKKDQYYRNYRLKANVLEKSLAQIIGLKPAAHQLSAQERYRQKIVSSFIRHGKLQSIPVQKKKRLVILAELAACFKKNKKYPEKEVNRILGEFHEDFCTIRRELISYKFMERKNGIYQLLETPDIDSIA